MKHLMSAVVFAALVSVALPAAAQTSATGSSKQPSAAAQGQTTTADAAAAQSGTSKKSGKHGGKHKKTKPTARGKRDTDLAEQLNREELQRLTTSGAAPGVGTSVAPAAPQK